MTRAGTRARAARGVIAIAGALSAACGRSPAGPSDLSSITIAPNATLAIGGTQQFTAVGRDASGKVVAITPAWSVVASGGSITSLGLFTAGTVSGTFVNTVRAASGGISATASVTVMVGSLAVITVSPAPLTLPIGGAQQFTAAGVDASGNVVAITPTWSVVASGGTIDNAGQFIAGSVPGTFANTVQATSGGISGAASITVVAGPLATIIISPDSVTLSINGTQQFTAVGRDAGGNIVAMTATWSVVAGGGSISLTGLFSAGTSPGSFANTVRASSGAISGTGTVTVVAGALATIAASPDTATLAINSTQQFTAVGRDAAGNIVAITPSWSVVASGGSISNTGLFTAGTVPGTFANTVRVTSGAISGTATVSVITGLLATITLIPSTVSLPIGGTQQFTAEGRDAGGNVVAITPTWSVVASGGSITAAGLFTAGNAVGTFVNTVRATSGAVSGTATVSVIAGPLSTITVSPASVTLLVNGTQQFTAVGRDADGNVVAITAVWTVTANGGSISGAGLFTAGTAVGTFANTVRATSGAIAGTASVTVTAGLLATITVTPNPDTLAGGASRQFTAVGRDAGGNVVALTPAWSVISGGGVIDNSGSFVAGMTRGTFANTIQATSGSIIGTATIVVVVPLVDLGLAETLGVLGGSTVTCAGGTAITGDVGVFPGTAITGFPTCTASAMHAGNPYAQLAHGSVDAAYAQLAAMTCTVTQSADLGGQVLTPGVYCAPAAEVLTGEVVLDAQGDPNAFFVLRAGSTLTTTGATVTLRNGAQAHNVYWVVGSSATLTAGSALAGNLIVMVSITVENNVTILGRALAINGAVTLGTGITIIRP